MASNQAVYATLGDTYSLMCMKSPGTSFLGLILDESMVLGLEENAWEQNSSDTGQNQVRT